MSRVESARSSVFAGQPLGPKQVMRTRVGRGYRPASIEEVIALRLARLEDDADRAPHFAQLLARQPVSRSMAAIAAIRAVDMPTRAVRDLELIDALARPIALVRPPTRTVAGLALEGSYLGVANMRDGVLLRAEKCEVADLNGGLDPVAALLDRLVDPRAGSVIALEEWSEQRSTPLRIRVLAVLAELAESRGILIERLAREDVLQTYGDPALPRRRLRDLSAQLWPSIQPRAANGVVLDAAALAFAVELALVARTRD